MVVMRKYLYETHMHTSEVSACASTSGAEQARIYKELGYDGIIVTDHFYNGNTAISRNMPWELWVENFTRGYENAKKEGDKIGLSVFFGWEESFQGNDFLVYGLDKDWLLNHPQILDWSIEEHYKQIKAAGGYFVHAHPYREASYIHRVRLFPSHVDAVEIINSSHVNPKFDRRARAYAAKNKLRVTAGSDAHHSGDLRGGMLFNHKLESIQDFIRAMESREEVELVRDALDLSYDYKRVSSSRSK